MSKIVVDISQSTICSQKRHFSYTLARPTNKTALAFARQPGIRLKVSGLTSIIAKLVTEHTERKESIHDEDTSFTPRKRFTQRKIQQQEG